LPSGWRWVILGEICIGKGQYGFSEKASSSPEGIAILRMNNIQDGVISWDNLKYVQLSGDLVNQYRLMEGDLLINRTNSAELVGKSAIFKGTTEAIFASYIIRFRINSDKANPGLICNFIEAFEEYPAACRGDEFMPFRGGYKGDRKVPLIRIGPCSLIC
jgi:type I restriction enzyme S subunit